MHFNIFTCFCMWLNPLCVFLCVPFFCTKLLKKIVTAQENLLLEGLLEVGVGTYSKSRIKVYSTYSVLGILQYEVCSVQCAVCSVQ